jgi:hypothetical protein
MTIVVSGSIDATELKQILADYLTAKSGGQTVFAPADIKVRCKSKYNVNATWEGCDFRADFSK